jgi:hypothetical protein
MVAGDLRIAIEQPLADPEDVETAKKNDRQQNAEDDSQRQDRVAVFVDNRQDRARTHLERSPMRRSMAGFE